MLSSFAFIGRMLDRTRLSFEGKERFKELSSQFNTALGGIGLTFVFLLVTLVAGLGVWYFATHPAPSRFFLPTEVEASAAPPNSVAPNASAGPRIVLKEVDASRSPRMSNARMQSWVTRALIDAYTFDFTTVDKTMRDISVVFRDDTYDKFLAQMNRNKGIIATVKENSLIVSLTPTSEVRVIQQGVNGGQRIWMVEQRAAIYYSGALEKTPPPAEVLFTLLVQEVSPTVSPYGLVITQISQSGARSESR